MHTDTIPHDVLLDPLNIDGREEEEGREGRMMKLMMTTMMIFWVVYFCVPLMILGLIIREGIALHKKNICDALSILPWRVCCLAFCVDTLLSILHYTIIFYTAWNRPLPPTLNCVCIRTYTISQFR